METPGGPALRAALLLLLLWGLRARGDGGDFDLADALDEPDPTPPSRPSGGLYPRLPQDPLPSDPQGGSVYPPPRPRPQPPRPRPQPRPHPGEHEDGGNGGFGSYGGHGDSHGGVPPPTHDSTQGNTVARIVSPIVSVVVVALLGAGVSYFRSGRGRGCLGRADSGTV